MRKMSLEALVFTVFYLSPYVQHGTALNFTITPAISNGLVPNEISFHCRPDPHETFMSDIIQMRLMKEGVTIVKLQKNSKPILTNDEVGQNFQFSGGIKRKTLDSFLSAILTNTKEEGLFHYECEVVFLDNEQEVRVMASTSTLTMSNTDIVPIYYNLKKRLTTLHTALREEIAIAKTIVAPLKKLQNIYQKQLSESDGTKEKCAARKEASTVYFLGWSGKVVNRWKKGENLINWNMAMNQGDGYNRTTGTFTAPVPGYYLFHVSITASGGDWIYVHLMASNHRLPLARLRAGDGQSWPEQADTSCVVKLDIGDKVEARIGEVSSNFQLFKSDYMNRFVGVLLGQV